MIESIECVLIYEKIDIHTYGELFKICGATLGLVVDNTFYDYSIEATYLNRDEYLKSGDEYFFYETAAVTLEDGQKELSMMEKMEFLIKLVDDMENTIFVLDTKTGELKGMPKEMFFPNNDEVDLMVPNDTYQKGRKYLN